LLIGQRGDFARAVVFPAIALTKVGVLCSARQGNNRGDALAALHDRVVFTSDGERMQL